MAAGRSPIVVANGVEGEPASHKDSLLMRINPHLVLDGAAAAAAAVGARTIVIAVNRSATSAHASLAGAIAERARSGRRERFELVTPPDRFVAGEETALVQWLNGGPAKPAFVPPRPYERGVRGRPTLVQNVETLANIALIARHGPDWFRELGSDAEPGSMLVTLGGAVGRPGIAELESGPPAAGRARALAATSTQPRRQCSSAATSAPGYRSPRHSTHRSPRPGCEPLGASLGARSLTVLPHATCGVAETARLAAYLAGESAGQCGPCVFGLSAIADALRSIAACDADAGDALKRLRRIAPQVTGRGACAHPNGATRLVASALTVFRDELAHHLAGHCTARSSDPVLPIPAAGTEWR